jgi:hypothetical protein
LVGFSFPALSQTGIGTTTPDASAQLDVSSTTKGFLPPRMTEAQRNAITLPADGLVIYQTDGTAGLYVRSSSAWVKLDNSGGGIDFSNLNISAIKADLSQTSQTQYGRVVTVKASSDVDNGAIVVWDYSGSEVKAKMPAGTTPNQHEIIGIAIEKITSGNIGKVLIYGYATAKIASQTIPVVPTLLLDGTSSGNTTNVSDVSNATIFQDEGGNGNYSPSSNYIHTFYNHGGNISLKFINWDLEHSSTRMYDRLGFTVSNDGITFTNAEFIPFTSNNTEGGFKRSSVIVAPWSSVIKEVDSTGYILSKNPGLSFPVNSLINTGYKYVRAYFYSDNSTQFTGWEIEVYGTNATIEPTITSGGTVFVDPTDLSATSTNNTTGLKLGNYVGTDVSNNAVVVFIKP